jgi:hypothetical protein
MRAGIQLCDGDAALDLVGDATLAVIGTKMQFAAALKRCIPGMFIARAHCVVVAPPQAACLTSSLDCGQSGGVEGLDFRLELIAGCATSFFRCLAASLYMISSHGNCGVEILSVALFAIGATSRCPRFL